MEHLDRLEPEGLDSVEQPLAGPEQTGTTSSVSSSITPAASA
jgi:hypothetical protein